MLAETKPQKRNARGKRPEPKGSLTIKGRGGPNGKVCQDVDDTPLPAGSLPPTVEPWRDEQGRP